MKSEFEDLNKYHEAIKDINKIINNPAVDKSSSRIDEALNAIKDIDKREIDEDIELRILNDLKDAVVKIYADMLKNILVSVDMDLEDIGKIGVAKDHRSLTRDDAKSTTSFNIKGGQEDIF